MKRNGIVARISRLLPLTIFLLCASWFGRSQGVNGWLTAFMLGGLAAGLQLGWLIYRKSMVNRLILAVDVYLIVGGIASALHLDDFLLALNGAREVGVMVAIVVVGVGTTFLSKAGFIGCPDAPAPQIRRYSLLFLACAVLALLLSLQLKGAMLFSAVIPITSLFFINGFLCRLAREQCSC